MKRKDFIKTCGLSCLGGVSFLALLEACGTASYYAQNTITKDKIIVKKSEFSFVKDNKTVLRKYVLIRSEQLSFPICLYKLSELEFSALSMECTHKSCELQVHGSFLICPCHGSEFSNTGVVQNPPAESNLKTYTITTDHENIYIQL